MCVMSNQLSEQTYAEFQLLMSLALDDLLDADEKSQFEEHLQRHPVLAKEWQDWQLLHCEISAMPHAMPAPNFVDRFEVKLAQQERRRKLWQGLWIGVVSMVLWFIAAAGVITVSTYLFVNQPSLMSDVVQNVIFFFASLATSVDSLALAISTFAETPQAIGLGVGYLVLAMSMLMGWVVYLRRSTQLLDVAVS